MRMLNIQLKKFMSAGKPVEKTRACRKLKKAKNAKYCDESIVPELGHRHLIRLNSLNKHLKNQYFEIIDVDDKFLVTLKLIGSKKFTIYKKHKGGFIKEQVKTIVRPKGDLIYNPANVYHTMVVNNHKIKKKNGKAKKRVYLEPECVIKLLNTDPIIEDCAFMVKELEIQNNIVKCKVTNGSKIEPRINPFDYTDEIEGGYDYRVVASAKQVKEDSHPLYGYCEEAYMERVIPTPDEIIERGIIVYSKGRYRVKGSHDLFDISDEQNDIMFETNPPVGETVEFTISEDTNIAHIKYV